MKKTIKTILSVVMAMLLLSSLFVTSFIPANAADNEIKATDSKIRYTGHWVKSGDNMKGYFQSTIEVRFTGTSLKVKCNRALAVKIDKSYYKIVDPVNGIIDAASGLKAGDHKAILIISVPIAGPSDVKHTLVSGFVIDSGASLLSPDNSKHIAFIGDSITMGHYGQSSFFPSGITFRDSIAQNYVTKLAEKLDMVPNATAIGGHGIEKANSTAIDTIGMAERYFRQGGMYSDAGNKPFDTSLYVPDYVVVALGTNGSYDSMSAFAAQGVYEEMLVNLRKAYPKAKIFCVTPFQSTGLSSLSYKIYDIIEASVDYRNMDGDNDVYFINASTSLTNPAQIKNDPSGQTTDGVHPTYDGHDLIATSLAKKIKAALNKDNQSSSSSKKQYGSKDSSKVSGTSSNNNDKTEEVADSSSKKNTANKNDKTNNTVSDKTNNDTTVDIEYEYIDDTGEQKGIMDYIWILITAAAVVVVALLVVIFLPQIKALFKK